MNTKTYNPCPVDTSDVELPQELLELVEAMAKNVHELWAQGRISEGWAYSPNRNDKLRLTPCLVRLKICQRRKKPTTGIRQ